VAPGQLDADVIIAGGGPAGAATAIACAQRGLRVRLFERALFVGHRPGETLHPGIEPLLRQLGLAERFQATVGARHSGIWLSWGDRKHFQPYGPDQDGAWQGFQVSRTAFDRLLLDYAHEQGVEVRQPCAVDRVLLASENEIRVLTGAGRFSARIIVDATGRASWLSRRSAAGFCSELDEAPELVGDSTGWVWTGWVPVNLRGMPRVGPLRGASALRLTTERGRLCFSGVGPRRATCSSFQHDIY
jgi:2-polyprenyl-6-methoxyphenol hydroxylase-like FAD-dependent oxidoreductase